FGTFIFRTTGFNSIRTLAARLSYYHAASGGLLSCLPLQLTLRGKSTTQSYRQPVYYVDLTLREGVSLNEAIMQAKQMDEQSKQAGFYQEAVD
ncbi:hydrolase or metal-binding protein, partial [Acinetobacter ursingii]